MNVADCSHIEIIEYLMIDYFYNEVIERQSGHHLHSCLSSSYLINNSPSLTFTTCYNKLLIISSELLEYIFI